MIRDFYLKSRKYIPRTVPQSSHGYPTCHTADKKGTYGIKTSFTGDAEDGVRSDGYIYTPYWKKYFTAGEIFSPD